MIKYVEKNVNPKNKKTTDCVVRALTEATGKPYADVYMELVQLSLKTGYFINEKRLEDKFLEQNGFIKHKQPKKLDNTKYTIGELDKLVSGLSTKKVIVRCAHHLACISGGALVDTWDCRYKTINNYYTKA